MTDYEALEREHFGDPDKRTGVYAPKVIEGHCSHGKTWAEEYPDCALVSAKEFVKRWGKAVDEARKVIAESEKEGGEDVSIDYFISFLVRSPGDLSARSGRCSMKLQRPVTDIGCIGEMESILCKKYGYEWCAIIGWQRFESQAETQP